MQQKSRPGARHSRPMMLLQEMKKHSLGWRLLVAFLLLVSNTGIRAETAEEKGLAIAVEADRRDSGWGDQAAAMEMILKNKRGDESSRTLRMTVLEMTGDGDKSLLVFDSPPDVKGTAFLSYTHALEPDDQWLYLPDLKRVKRIASADKSGSFVGSEFAYEDLTSQEVEKYDYRWLRDETVDGRDAFVIERVPRDPHSGYRRQYAWVDKEMYRPVQVDFYDRKDALLKSLHITGYRQYLDRYWRPDRMEMINHQNGNSTVMSWNNYRFNNGLTERDFDQNALKRAR